MVELIWDGKYDASGKRTAPLRLKLPFQTVETVNATAQQRQLALDLFNTGRPTEWRNRLIWGDKKYVLPALLDEFGGQVDLIYIDPPFATGADFSFQVEIEDERFTKEASIIEQKAYRDTWGQGLDSYLKWFYETVVLLRELLTENGSLYVHLDWHVVHYAKVVLDEVFGEDFFESQIVWQRVTSHSDRQGFGLNHDVLLMYARGNTITWNPQFVPHEESYIKSHYTQVDVQGAGLKPPHSESKALTGWIELEELCSFRPMALASVLRHDFHSLPTELFISGRAKLKPSFPLRIYAKLY